MGSELGSLIATLLERERWTGEITGLDIDPPRRRLRSATFHRVAPNYARLAERHADESQRAAARTRVVLKDGAEQTRELEARRSVDAARGLAGQQRDELLKRLAELQAEMDRIRQQLR